jgi:hypothetical protein
VFKSQEHLVIVCAVAAVLVVAAHASAAPAGSANSEAPTIARCDDDLSGEEHMLRELIAQSFPALAHVAIRLKPCHSDSDYFRTSFSAHRFAFGMKMQYVVLRRSRRRSPPRRRDRRCSTAGCATFRSPWRKFKRHVARTRGGD